MPEARIGDGVIDVLLVRAAPRLRLLRLLSQLPGGRHLDSPLVQVRKVRRLSLVAEVTDCPLVIDGEMMTYQPLDVQVLPGAINLLA